MNNPNDLCVDSTLLNAFLLADVDTDPDAAANSLVAAYG
jgi:hypothetical protein